MMAAVRGRDTKPELLIRRLVHGLGYRFKLHRRDLPGRPDLVLPRLKVCIFVHGCFWHHHPGCKHATTPSSNVIFWTQKFAQNSARDAQAELTLRDVGWEVIVVWECETRENEMLVNRLRGELERADPRSQSEARKPIERPQQGGKMGGREPPRAGLRTQVRRPTRTP